MIKIDHILERESQNFLDEHVASIDKKGVEVITRVFKGKLIDTIEFACKSLGVDLIVLEPRTNSIKEEVYLGNTSGKIIKQTQTNKLKVVPKFGLQFFYSKNGRKFLENFKNFVFLTILYFLFIFLILALTNSALAKSLPPGSGNSIPANILFLVDKSNSMFEPADGLDAKNGDSMKGAPVDVVGNLWQISKF